MKRRGAICALAVLLRLCATAAIPDAGGGRHEELRRFKAAEANQGVAVDAEFFYAIDNHAIGKYRKDTGARVGGWDGGKGGRIQHLNAGVLLDGRLYCAHSNFPKLPAESSVEMWNTATMQPVASHHVRQAGVARESDGCIAGGREGVMLDGRRKGCGISSSRPRHRWT